MYIQNNSHETFVKTRFLQQFTSGTFVVRHTESGPPITNSDGNNSGECADILSIVYNVHYSEGLRKGRLLHKTKGFHRYESSQRSTIVLIVCHLYSFSLSLCVCVCVWYVCGVCVCKGLLYAEGPFSQC